jgi:hypothetical protein
MSKLRDIMSLSHTVGRLNVQEDGEGCVLSKELYGIKLGTTRSGELPSPHRHSPRTTQQLTTGSQFLPGPCLHHTHHRQIVAHDFKISSRDSARPQAPLGLLDQSR